LTEADVRIADFTGFNGQTFDPYATSIRIFGPHATVAQDLEPEYIAVDPNSLTAYVTLQENNALAIVDIGSATVTELVGLGFKDHRGEANALDASNKDKAINIAPWPVFGMFLPDAIDCFQVNGDTYLITANEGDSRDYDGFSEEERVADLDLDPGVFPEAVALQDPANLGRLKITTTLGDMDSDGQYESLFSYGARSFSIWTTAGELVFDSGSELEWITAAADPRHFNATNDENEFDDRSDDKGPEPEGVVTGVAYGRMLAFIGLERVGGIVVYDVTDPTSPEFVDYLNNRNFACNLENESVAATPAPRDLGPEGLAFIAAGDSPNGRPLLAVGNEVSGSTTLFEIRNK
jgi:hypothetical protein